MVQLAWSIFVLEGETKVKRSLIVRADDFNPNPKGRLKHGINRARSLREGVSAETVLQEFKNDLTVFGVQVLVAHNIEFDEMVLKAESQRLKIDFTDIFSLPKLCTMKSCVSRLKLVRPAYERRLEAYRKNHNMRTQRARRGLAFYKEILSDWKHKYPTLRELHLHLFGSDILDWHNAAADVDACARCFRIIAKERMEAHVRRSKELEEDRLQIENRRIENEERKAAVERKAKIMSERKTAKSCLMCGKRLGLFSRLIRARRHYRCTEFHE